MAVRPCRKHLILSLVRTEKLLPAVISTFWFLSSKQLFYSSQSGPLGDSSRFADGGPSKKKALTSADNQQPAAGTASRIHSTIQMFRFVALKNNLAMHAQQEDTKKDRGSTHVHLFLLKNDQHQILAEWLSRVGQQWGDHWGWKMISIKLQAEN